MRKTALYATCKFKMELILPFLSLILAKFLEIYLLLLHFICGCVTMFVDFRALRIYKLCKMEKSLE